MVDILDVLRQGAQATDELGQTSSLREAAESLLAILDRFDGFGVVGASPHAERVIGAAMMLDPTMRATGDGRTVIFDVSIASGTLMARAAQRLRNSGNDEQLVGVALYSLIGHHFELSSSELDSVVIANPSEQPDLAARKRSESSENSIMLAC